MRPWFWVGEVSGTFGTIAHVEPFQFSIRFWLWVPLTWPADSQKEAPAHETEARKLPVTPPPVGMATVTRDHEDPFHCSLNGVAVALPTLVVPTAMHEVVVTQSIPVASITGGLPDALGVAADTSDHAVPFHWLPNTSGVPTLNPVPSVSHTVVETHETDQSAAPPVTLDGITGLASVHAVPFQVSATAPRPDDPTAMQNEGPTQDTDTRLSSLVAATLTLGTTAHDDPFHCSTRVPPPAPLFCCPTATQNDAVVQETSLRRFDPEADGACAFVHCDGADRRGRGEGRGPAGRGWSHHEAERGHDDTRNHGCERSSHATHPRLLARQFPSGRTGYAWGSAASSASPQAVAATTISQLSMSSGPPRPARNVTSRKPAASSHTTHSGGVGSRMK